MSVKQLVWFIRRRRILVDKSAKSLAQAPESMAERLKSSVIRAGGGTAVSKKSGVPLSTINEYLKGNEARFSKMAAVAKACGVSLDWLAQGEDEDSPTPDLIMLRSDVLHGPAHFWGLFVLIRSCQEYNEQMGFKPTLAKVLEWIGPSYLEARSLPDKRIELRPPEP